MYNSTRVRAIEWEAIKDPGQKKKKKKKNPLKLHPAPDFIFSLYLSVVLFSFRSLLTWELEIKSAFHKDEKVVSPFLPLTWKASPAQSGEDAENVSPQSWSQLHVATLHWRLSRGLSGLGSGPFTGLRRCSGVGMKGTTFSSPSDCTVWTQTSEWSEEPVSFLFLFFWST